MGRLNILSADSVINSGFVLTNHEQYVTRFCLFQRSLKDTEDNRKSADYLLEKKYKLVSRFVVIDSGRKATVPGNNIYLGILRESDNDYDMTCFRLLEKIGENIFITLNGEESKSFDRRSDGIFVDCATGKEGTLESLADCHQIGLKPNQLYSIEDLSKEMPNMQKRYVNSNGKPWTTYEGETATITYKAAMYQKNNRFVGIAKKERAAV